MLMKWTTADLRIVVLIFRYASFTRNVVLVADAVASVFAVVAVVVFDVVVVVVASFLEKKIIENIILFINDIVI